MVLASRFRALAFLAALACGFTGVSLKLIQIQLIQHDFYWSLEEQRHLRSETIPQRRGAIFDSAGDVLAETITVWDVRLDGMLTLRENEDLGKIAAILRVPQPDLLKKFTHQNRDILLASDQDEAVASQLKDLKLRALKLLPHDKRVYPNGGLAAHVIGYMDLDGKGAAGIEKQEDELLTGTPGKRWIEMDVSRHPISGYQPQQNVPVEDGASVNLTINLAIQQVVEEQLNQIVQNLQPEGAYIIVMQPKTGEIMALANRPAFDPNDRGSYQPDLLANRCITEAVEPGSIFKIVPVSAALNEGAIKLTTPIFCENGSFFYGGKTLHDDEPEGWLTAKEVLAKSSNIGCAKISLNFLHEKLLYEYARRYGFGQPTGIFTGQGESAGVLRPLKKWSGVSITHVPMGQEVGATPMQMVAAMSAIANGGIMMKPHLIRSVTNCHGKVVDEFQPTPLRQVISPDAAQAMTVALKAVLTEGTGSKVPMKNYILAGKTGTAQIFEHGAYSKTKHVSSFLGFFPADDPQVCMLVMIRAAQTRKDYGAEVSLPVFIDLSSQIGDILNIPHDFPQPSMPVSIVSRPRSTPIPGDNR